MPWPNCKRCAASWALRWPLVWTWSKIVAIVVPLMLGVAYLTFAERKVIGYMQVRIGPNRVGPQGWLQPIADALKLLFKEIIIPTGANKFLFMLAPILAIAPALAAWAVMPFTDELVLANIDASLLYILAITSMGVYGVIIAGWASNSKYAFLGAMRSAAQIVSYEIAMGFALVGVLMAAHSLNLSDIVQQASSAAGLPAVVLPAAVPAVPGVLDLRRGRDQSRAVRRGRGRIRNRRRLPCGIFRHGLRGVLPGRIRQHDPGRDADHAHVPGRLAVAVLAVPAAIGFAWLLGQVVFMLFLFLWFRATFPRYRYDQIMRLGWKVFIPVTLVWMVVIGAGCRRRLAICSIEERP